MFLVISGVEFVTITVQKFQKNNLLRVKKQPGDLMSRKINKT